MTVTSQKALRPLTFAHRGGVTFAPENTLAAITKALDLSPDFIEIDVHMTSDDQLVVIHDDTVDRTTNGIGPVSSFTLRELQRLDAGSRYYQIQAMPAGEAADLRVPTLLEVLELVRGRTGICIEIKHPYLYPGLEQRVLNTLESVGVRKGDDACDVVLQSFSVGSMRLLAVLAPHLTRFQLVPRVRQLTPRDLDDIRSYADGIGRHKSLITPELVADAHERGLRLHAYTVNCPREMRVLLSMGVDGLISDDVPELNRACAARGTTSPPLHPANLD